MITTAMTTPVAPRHLQQTREPQHTESGRGAGIDRAPDRVDPRNILDDRLTLREGGREEYQARRAVL